MTTQPQGSTPVPDPTVLTTQQLVAQVSVLKDFIATTRELLETRLDAMDTATKLNKEQMEKFPQMMHETVAATERVRDGQFQTVNEKFRSIDTQFAERDTRTESVAQLGQKALEAALSAAKEAVGEQNKSNALANAKMEAAFTKQIDGITLLIQNAIKALDEKINDLKGRMDRGEGSRIQSGADKDQHNWVVGLVVTCILALLGNAITLVFLFTHMGK